MPRVEVTARARPMYLSSIIVCGGGQMGGGVFVVCGLRYDRGIMFCVVEGLYGSRARIRFDWDGREVVVS